MKIKALLIASALMMIGSLLVLANGRANAPLGFKVWFGGLLIVSVLIFLRAIWAVRSAK